MTYKLICFDLDGTLVDGTDSIWQTLHDHFGTDKVLREEMMRKAIQKEITYAEWFYQDLHLFARHGATKEIILQVVRNLTLIPGARETVEILKEAGYRLAVISGSLNIVLEELFPDHPFHHVLINEIHFDPEGRLIGGLPTPFDLEEKAIGMRMIAEKEQLSLDECVFVGDNENDVDAARVVGLAFSFNSKSPLLDTIANVVIREKDLRNLLDYLNV